MHEDTLAIEAIREGDTDRYEELVERYQRLVQGIAWSRIGDAGLSEDAVQETFIQGFRFLSTLRRPERFGAWIARIARNVAVSVRRRRRRELSRVERWHVEDAPAAPDDASDSGGDVPLTAMLSESLAALPDRYRECLVLFYLEEHSVRDAARLLGVGESTFRVRLHRARKALRGVMEERLEGSLKRLRPPSNLGRRVLAAVPAAPIGWGGAASGIALTLLQGLLQYMPTFLYLGVITRSLARNYRDGEPFRRRLTWEGYVAMVVYGAPFLAAFFLVQRHFGLRALAGALAVFMFPTVVVSLLQLRLNRTAFARAIALGMTAMFTAFTLVAVLDWSYLWFALAMLVFNTGLWLARKSAPMRSDYNLFLRAAGHGLGDPDPDVRQARGLARDQLMAFARFLGDMFLIADCVHNKAGVTVCLPPVGSPATWAMLPVPRRYLRGSTVTLFSDGRCRAHLCAKDLRQLEKLGLARTEEAQRLETQVASVVLAALALFQRGETEQAAALLQRETDAEVFVQPAHRLTSQRVMYALGVLSAVVMVVLWLLVPQID